MLEKDFIQGTSFLARKKKACSINIVQTNSLFLYLISNITEAND